MKVFISLPMHGKTDEEIQATITHAREQIRMIFHNHGDLVILNNYSEVEEIGAHFHGRLWYLGRAVQKMDRCDFVYFCKGWQEAKGCQVEHYICELYNIQRIEEK